MKSKIATLLTHLGMVSCIFALSACGGSGGKASSNVSSAFSSNNSFGSSVSSASLGNSTSSSSSMSSSEPAASSVQSASSISVSSQVASSVSSQVASSSSSATSSSVGANEPPLEGSTRSLQFTSGHTGLPVKFSIYLPPGYEDSEEHYPVIYHLHGINGKHDSAQVESVSLSLEAAIRDGLIGAAIIVFPDAYTDTFWADSAVDTYPAETHLVPDLVAYIDERYRTRADREHRVIQGFSMGGFGAAKFATKFPELFAVCVTYDAAMLNWDEVGARHSSVASDHFNNDEALFNEYSPWYWLEQHADDLRSTVVFRSIGGSLLAEENERWRSALEENAQQFDFVATDLQHALLPLLNAEGANSWAFIAEHMGQ